MQNSNCTDISNIHAITLEIFVGIAIAVGVFLYQGKNQRKRRKHALSEITFQLFKLDKIRVELHNLVNQYYEFDYELFETVNDNTQTKTREQVLGEIDDNRTRLKELVATFKTNLLLFTQDLPSEEVSFLDTIANELLLSFDVNENEKEVKKRLIANDFMFHLVLTELRTYDKDAVDRAFKRWQDIQGRLKKLKTNEI